jgi:hypothetical protein
MWSVAHQLNMGWRIDEAKGNRPKSDGFVGQDPMDI